MSKSFNVDTIHRKEVMNAFTASNPDEKTPKMYFNAVMHDNCHHRASTVLALTSEVATTRLNRDDKAVTAAAMR